MYKKQTTNTLTFLTSEISQNGFNLTLNGSLALSSCPALIFSCRGPIISRSMHVSRVRKSHLPTSWPWNVRIGCWMESNSNYLYTLSRLTQTYYHTHPLYRPGSVPRRGARPRLLRKILFIFTCLQKQHLLCTCTLCILHIIYMNTYI